MATKAVTLLLLLFVAIACVVVQAHTADVVHTSEKGVSLLGRHPSVAVEQAIHPQAGCRCCFFKRVGAFLQCGTVCCQDGCC